MKPGNLKLYFLFFFLIFFTGKIFSSPIEGNKVSLKILDKITSHIESIDLGMNKDYEFGTLQIKIYTCFKSPPEEVPENYVLLKILDNLIIDDNNKNIYQGWMISSSPSATPLEHAIYDVWVSDCKIDNDS